MLTIYLCDDDQVIASKYKSKISDILIKNNTKNTIHTFKSGDDLIRFHLNQQSSPDILFLDIEMDNMNGISVAKKLRSLNFVGIIVFITSSKDYLLDSFDVDAMHYVIKNHTTSSKFEEIVLKATFLASKKICETFVCESKGDIKNIPIDNISHFEISNRIATVFYCNEQFEFYSTLDKILEKLDIHDFVRCHRSFLVNMKYIKSIKKDCLLTTDNHNIPIGKSYSEEMKKKFSKHHSSFLL